MKLLQSLCLASALATSDPVRSGPTCKLAELAEPDHFEKWECYKRGSSAIYVGTGVPAGAKCYLNCLSGYTAYTLNGRDFHRCTNQKGKVVGDLEWTDASRMNVICAKDLADIITELDEITARTVENQNRIDVISNTNLFTPLARISQQNVKINTKFGNENFALRPPTTIPDGSRFMLADVWLNDATNQAWSVTFSKDEITECRGFSLANSGSAPLTNFDGGNQTVTVLYEADQVEDSLAYSRFGQWSSSVMIPLGSKFASNRDLPEYHVCIAGKDSAVGTASILLYVRGYFQ